MYFVLIPWASAISILIGNWHISISSEPYIVNLLEMVR